MVAIEVADDARWDRETPVRVTGLAPGTTVTLTARTDAWFLDGGESRVTFEVDDDGILDTAESAPVEVDCAGVAPMGWLWSIDGEGAAVPSGEDAEVELAVGRDGDELATATTTRRRAGSGVSTREVEVDGLVGELFVPDGAGPHPGVLALHGSGGRPRRGVAALLASEGYATLAIQYFGDPAPLPDALKKVSLEYFERGATWLRKQSDVSDADVGVVGQSKGAEAALEVASRYDWVGSVVATSPSVYRWQALEQSPREPSSSWSADGDPLPFVPFGAPPRETDRGTLVCLDAYEASTERSDNEVLDAARIPVERIEAPTLLVSGGEDAMWQSGDFARTVMEHLDGEDHEHRHFEEAGHGFGIPYSPRITNSVAGGMELGGDAEANARASAAAWEAVRSHLAESLR
jgi:dienelactone hydrolase